MPCHCGNPNRSRSDTVDSSSGMAANASPVSTFASPRKPVAYTRLTGSGDSFLLLSHASSAASRSPRLAASQPMVNAA